MGEEKVRFKTYHPLWGFYSEQNGNLLESFEQTNRSKLSSKYFFPDDLIILEFKENLANLTHKTGVLVTASLVVGYLIFWLYQVTDKVLVAGYTFVCSREAPSGESQRFLQYISQRAGHSKRLATGQWTFMYTEHFPSARPLIRKKCDANEKWHLESKSKILFLLILECYNFLAWGPQFNIF